MVSTERLPSLRAADGAPADVNEIPPLTDIPDAPTVMVAVPVPAEFGLGVTDIPLPLENDNPVDACMTSDDNCALPILAGFTLSEFDETSTVALSTLMDIPDAVENVREPAVATTSVESFVLLIAALDEMSALTTDPPRESLE